VTPGSYEVQNDQLPTVATSFVAASPDVIVCGPELPIRALQKLTQTIPLIGMTEDMVGEGLVASLARPGGNTTGISLLSPELDGKRQDILIEAAPAAHRIAIVSDARTMQADHVQVLQQGARSHGVEASHFGGSGPDEIRPAIM